MMRRDAASRTHRQLQVAAVDAVLAHRVDMLIEGRLDEGAVCTRVSRVAYAARTLLGVGCEIVADVLADLRVLLRVAVDLVAEGAKQAVAVARDVGSVESRGAELLFERLRESAMGSTTTRTRLLRGDGVIE